MNYDVQNNEYMTIKKILSSFTISIVSFIFILINISYIYGVAQPVRWPSLIYFFISLMIATASKKWSFFSIVLIFPLLPDLHIQLQYLLKPSVKYFIAYPGIDVINGFLVGTYVRNIITNKSFKFKFPFIPWPLQVLFLILFLSGYLAISRNLWQSGSDFYFSVLIDSLLRVKLLSPLSDYYPITFIYIYSYAILLFSSCNDLFKSENNIKIFIKAVLAGLLISALLGIFQAITGFGLPITTSGYRTEILGYGAHGFQPDLHAFAAHMLLGTVGLCGLFFTKTTNKIKLYLFIIISICWVALLLSKSRASLIFAIFFTVLIIIFALYKSSKNLHKNSLYKYIYIFIVFIGFYTLFKSSLGFWIIDYYWQIKNVDSFDFAFINQLTRWRLEFHLAALRMWSEFPLWGLGLGEFYRQSSILEFSHSELMARSGGENAHNYFLQTLTDTGLVGYLGFVMIFLYPLYRTNNKSKLLVPGIFIFSLFLGNVFSHSFIIKENIFFLSIIIAYYYSQISHKESFKIPNVTKYILIFIFLLFIFGSYIEIKNSYFKMPFIQGYLSKK